MLSLLLDEQISPAVAAQLRGKQADVPVQSLYEWRAGAFVGASDDLVLRAAAQESLTLVTYDLKTIPPLLAEWGATGISHGGVIFVDNRTIPSHDFGGLLRSLLACWNLRQSFDWSDRVTYLEASR